MNNKEFFDKDHIIINEKTGEVIPISKKGLINEKYRDEIEEKKNNQKEAFKRKIEKDECSNYIKNNFGTFYFNFYKYMIKQELDPQYQFRFIYLCTYMNYDSILVDRNKNFSNNPLTRKDLDSILGLSKREVTKTLNKLKEKGLIKQTDDGLFKINQDICKRGNITTSDKRKQYARLFDDTIKNIYNRSNPKEHKFLNILIQLLPYINFKYNIICKNIRETDKELIEVLDIIDICDILNAYKNKSRFKNDLLKIKINETPAVMIAQVNTKTGIYINPKLYYKGNDLKALEALEVMFK